MEGEKLSDHPIYIMIVQYGLAKVYLGICPQETLTMQSQILNFDYLMIYDSVSLSGVKMAILLTIHFK